LAFSGVIGSSGCNRFMGQLVNSVWKDAGSWPTDQFRGGWNSSRMSRARQSEERSQSPFSTVIRDFSSR
jgi:hypothetical protein